MSQHIVCIHCEKIRGMVRIQLGWDKPMAEFYLVIIAEPPAEQQYNDEQIIYSNLDDPRSHAQELAYFKGVARELGCEVPESMWRAAYQDREFNVVNKTVFYSPVGDVVEHL